MYSLKTASLVLIETYWNVKSGLAHSVISFNSINRNILECKGSQCWWFWCSDWCINRNILECKVKKCVLMLLKHRSINRNILECKAVYGCNKCKTICVLIETYWNVKESWS